MFAATMTKEPIETRGAPIKYNFNIEVGLTIGFPAINAKKVRSALNSYLSRKGLKWKFKTWIEGNVIYLNRIK